MHVTNPNSNLTPSQDLKLGYVKSTFGIVTESRSDKLKKERQRGLNEHACHISTPYTCVSTAF